MATTTPNFGWPVPTSTDLVKDGATAIEALGDSIDASLLDLKGGTTGQVLSKNSGTDMDFTWVTDAAGDITGVTAGTGISGGGTSGTVTVTNSMATAIDAKGDLIAGTAADTFARLAVGTNNYILTADSAEATGIKWAAPAGGGKVLQVVQGTTGTATTLNTTTFTDTTITATITPSSASSKVLAMVCLNYYMGITGNSKGCSTQLLRGATSIFNDGTSSFGTGYIVAVGSSPVALANRVAMNYLDSPATTSATTYKLQAKTGNVNNDFVCQYDSAMSSIILLEIGA